jgi:hypothetical protein
VKAPRFKTAICRAQKTGAALIYRREDRAYFIKKPEYGLLAQGKPFACAIAYMHIFGERIAFWVKLVYH